MDNSKKINAFETGYKKGYWKAILDIKNYMNDNDLWSLKSKRQVVLFITSLCDYLLRNSIAMEKFIDYGGYVEVVVSQNKSDKGRVVSVNKR